MRYLRGVRNIWEKKLEKKRRKGAEKKKRKESRVALESCKSYAYTTVLTNPTRDSWNLHAVTGDENKNAPGYIFTDAPALCNFQRIRGGHLAMHSAYVPRDAFLYGSWMCHGVAERRILFHYNPLKRRRVRRLVNIPASTMRDLNDSLDLSRISANSR